MSPILVLALGMLAGSALFLACFGGLYRKAVADLAAERERRQRAEQLLRRYGAIAPIPSKKM